MITLQFIIQHEHGKDESPKILVIGGNPPEQKACPHEILASEMLVRCAKAVAAGHTLITVAPEMGEELVDYIQKRWPDFQLFTEQHIVDKIVHDIKDGVTPIVGTMETEKKEDPAPASEDVQKPKRTVH